MYADVLRLGLLRLRCVIVKVYKLDINFIVVEWRLQRQQFLQTCGCVRDDYKGNAFLNFERSEACVLFGQRVGQSPTEPFFTSFKSGY